MADRPSGPAPRRLPSRAPTRAPDEQERAARFVRLYVDTYVTHGRLPAGPYEALRAILAEGPLTLDPDQQGAVWSHGAALRAETAHEEDTSGICALCGDADDPRRDPLYHPEGLL